jgi:hypothetical protein
MTDAFRRRADTMVSTVVHLGIDAWPSGWLKSIVSVDRRPKMAYFALADALTPQAVNLRTDRHQVFGGECLSVEAWLMNDRPNALEGMQLVWWIENEGRVLFSQREMARLPVSGSHCQGVITWQTPEVNERTILLVKLALVDQNGRCLHDHHLPVEVFPQPNRMAIQGTAVGILGQQGQRAWKLAETLGMNPIPFAAVDTIRLAIADHPAAVEVVGASLAQFLECGGRLLCLEQESPAGHWQIAGQPVSWAYLDPCYFASRKTGHPAVTALGPFDLAYWYQSQEQRIEPTFQSVLRGDGLRPVVFSAAVVPPGIKLASPEFWPVTAELPIGLGKIIFSQVDAVSRIPTEPLAVQYLLGLLNYLIKHEK